MTRYERALAAAFGLAAVVVVVVYALAPSLRLTLVDEDRVLETATVLLLVAAAGLALVAVAGRSPGVAYHRAPAVAVGGLAVAAALDELSFGARIFGFETPVVEGASLDAVHDLVLITALFILHHGPVVGALTVLVLAAVGTAVAVWFWRSGLLNEVRNLRTARILAGAVAVAVVTTVIDLDQVPIPALQLWEELLETGGALLIVAAALAAPADCRLLGRRHAAGAIESPAAVPVTTA